MNHPQTRIQHNNVQVEGNEFFHHGLLRYCAQGKVVLSLVISLMVVAVWGLNSTVLLAQSAFEPGTIRLNIYWNSEEPELWSGHITLSGGRFSNTVPLGKDASAPVTFSTLQQNEGVLSFRTPKQVLFCGIQTTFHATNESVLTISLENAHWSEKLQRSFSIHDILTQPCWIPFDNKENGLIIERAAGDELAVAIRTMKNGVVHDTKNEIPSLVFEPGDILQMTVFPRLYQPLPDESLELVAQMTQIGQKQVHWSQIREVTRPVTGQSFVFQIPIPDMEGAFDVTMTLMGKKTPFSILPGNKEGKKGTTITSRTIQGVVVRSAERKNVRMAQPTPAGDLRQGLLETIDPTNPSWWKVFAKNNLFLGMNGTVLPFKENFSTVDAESPVPPFSEIEELSKKEGTASPIILGQKPSLSFRMDFLRKWKWGDFQLRLTPLRAEGRWGQWDELWQQSLGSGHLRLYDEKNPQYASLAQLLPDTTGQEIPWEAYTIPVQEPGKPHLLEIDYLSHVPQQLAISILESSVSGGIFPDSIDSGIVVSDNPLSDRTTDRILSHQILFWPRTKTPIILVMNKDKTNPAVFGRIRLYRAKDEAVQTTRTSSGRSFAAMLTRPLFVDQFSAARVPCSLGVTGAEDWNTISTAVERMSQYLRVRHYDTLLVSAYADGSSLYPSPLICSTPKYDSGIFLSRGEDPLRKDILELIIRRFESDSLAVIPQLSFNAPLPLLEERLLEISRSSDPRTTSTLEGIRWLGPEGRLLTEGNISSQGTGSYYNILHPLVQEAMLAVVAELVTRYGHQRGMKGLAIELSAEGFAQLPDDIYYGMDDITISRFIRESGMIERFQSKENVPLSEFLHTTGPQRYRVRAQFIKDYCRAEWLTWRSQAVYLFYRQMSDLLIRQRLDLRLYLLGTEMLGGQQSLRLLKPGPSTEQILQEAILAVGFDPRLFATTPTITLVRPGQLALSTPFGDQLESKLLESPEAIELFGSDTQTTSASFYHIPVIENIPRFDQKSPFQPTVTQIATRALPNAESNCQRFANQLAICDTLTFFDGGDMFALGQEDSLTDWISVFQTIPVAPFQTWNPLTAGVKGTSSIDHPENSANLEKNDNKESSTQPVVLRYRALNGEYWGYLVNNAPFHSGVRLSLRVQPGVNYQVFSGENIVNEPRLLGDSLEWSLVLRPYDLVAFKLSDQKATVTQMEVSIPDEIGGANGSLALAINDYVDRLLLARDGLLMELTNGNFEGVFTHVPNDPYKIPEPVNEDKQRKKGLLKNPFGSSDDKSAESVASEISIPERATHLAEVVPGWRQFGDPSFLAVLHSKEQREGKQSLCLESRGGAGGVMSRSLENSQTGRLCLQASFGVSPLTQSLPLQICLTGRYRGAPWQRQILVGPTIVAKAKQTNRQPALPEGTSSGDKEVCWVEEIIVFDQLPYEGLEELSLRIDLLGTGTVWVDDLRLYKFAFSEREQKAITLLAQQAESAFTRGQISDLLAVLDRHWSNLLIREIPDNLLVHSQRSLDAANKEEVASASLESTKKKKNFWGLFTR